MAKAKQDRLAELHAKVAEKILSLLDDPETVVQGCTLAIKFLKDNNVLADPELNDALNQIENKMVEVSKLPFPTKVS